MRDFQLPGRSAVYASNGICATSHPLAALVGVDMLRSGGNAVDAAIAMAFVLGICEPMMCGIGGDLFALVKPAGSDDVKALNASGRAPAGFDAAALRAAGHSTIPLDAPAAITMPGGVDGLCRLSEDWGRKGLAEVLAPAIHYADAGVPAAPRTADDWRKTGPRLKGAARRFYMNGDQPFALGQTFRQPQQADVLRKIAQQGRAGFYEGEVAEDMIASLQALGGSHTLADLAATRCHYDTPIAGMYRGAELIEHPPNGQGATAILLANILAQFDLAALDPFGAQRAHIEAEAAKLAYDARNRFIADPDHTTRVAQMLAPETATQLAALIAPDRVLASVPEATRAVHKDTVYLSVVDRDGMAVSMIYSIFHGFGSGLASDKFGILFQNRGAGFTLEQGHPNEAAGGKRPMHTIIPAMLREGGKISQSFGVMGGAYQPNGHARVLSNQRDFGMDLQEAIDAPRSFADGGVLQVERGYSDAVRQELADIGHDVQIPDTALGGAQAVAIDHANGVLIGASDPRKDGIALGY